MSMERGEASLPVFHISSPLSVVTMISKADWMSFSAVVGTTQPNDGVGLAMTVFSGWASRSHSRAVGAAAWVKDVVKMTAANAALTMRFTRIDGSGSRHAGTIACAGAAMDDAKLLRQFESLELPFA